MLWSQLAIAGRRLRPSFCRYRRDQGKKAQAAGLRPEVCPAILMYAQKSAYVKVRAHAYETKAGPGWFGIPTWDHIW
jgi:hypothetical protein